ncbi:MULTISPECIES: DUF4332 domain-containing protein [Prosthecochloris]|uniref:Ferredoxin n=1 Tax=Prosthecochloris marina TaxID=2017681 RepID=A0A317T8S6_9CHLB|nr:MULTISPECIES: DUF4332 domain-containing protein [Prosthecochloris]PWW83114.1 ferredoxin [Prosthecochloris marina]UZJ38723.1 DUF4332 domain-containing protein [Prosthecochloris sp. SCSIO W1103]
MDILINDKSCTGEVGEKLSKVALESKAHVGYVCAGLGICQTCYVTVLEGGDCLSGLSDVEEAFLSEKQIKDGARLACQATIERDGTIRILSRPEEVRRMALSNPLSLFSYSVEMGKAAAERFVPGVTNVIDRIQKGEVRGQAALDEAFSGMGSALQLSIDTATQSIPFKEQISGMVDFCKKMLPFSERSQHPAIDENIQHVALHRKGEQQETGADDPVADSTIETAGFESLGFVVADKLGSAGIFTFTDLLERGKTSKGRGELSSICNLSKKEVLTLVNYADLCRVRGIDVQTATLLEASGVDTVPELAHRNPSNLYEKILEVNKKQSIIACDPSQQDVDSWVAEAKTLRKVITY